ncbi:MAG: hypothetical protein U0N02_00020 [Clostridia bacterium]
MSDLNIKTNGIRIKSCGIILSMISLIVGFIISDTNPKGMYMYIPLLPFIFAFVNIAFLKIYDKITIVTIIVILMEFIRYVVTPVVLMIEDYPKGLYTYSFGRDEMLNCIITMLVEIIAIYCALYTCRNYSDIKITDESYVKKVLSKVNYSTIRISSFCIICLTLLLFVGFPGVRSIYKFILSNDMDSLIYNTSSVVESIPSGIGWLASVLGEITRYTIIEYILVRLFKKKCVKGKKGYFYISVIIVILNITVATSSLVVSLIASIVLLFQLYLLYPEFRRCFLVFGIIIGSVASIALVFNYLQNTLLYQSFSQMIQDYTNGYYNIYQAQFAYEAGGLNFLDKLEMLLLGDGIANISPFNIFFHVVNSSDIFNYYLYGKRFNGGAVLPYVSQWVYYFSPVLGPILSAIPIVWAKKVEKKWRNGEGNILVMGMLALVLALTPFMYNFPTLIHILSMSIFPLWLAAKANSIFILRIKQY